jgi:hypothetical protein
MKKIIPLIFSVLYVLNFNAQAVGGWGTCEFADVATMNAFDPSTNAYDCKKVFVQATNNHYYWNGTIWVLVQGTDNQNASEVPFTPVGTIVATDVQAAIAEIEPDIYGSVGVHSDVDVTTTTPSSGDVLAWDGSNFVPLTLEAGNILYDNSTSGLTATDAQAAIDELASGGSSSTPDNLGDHTAEENIQMIDYWISNDGDDEGIFIEGNGNVGIGTDNPNAFLDVDGGSVRFSDYGVGTYEDTTAIYLLGVEADGDLVEMNTAKNSRIFYPPAMALIVDVVGTGFSLNLHKSYIALFIGGENSFVKSTTAPGAIPTYAKDELYYYILSYDKSIFDNVTIDDDGIMEYDVIAPAVENCSFINIVFVVKEP